MTEHEKRKARVDGLTKHDLWRLDQWLDHRENQTLRDCFVIMPFAGPKGGRGEKEGRNKVYWTKFFKEFLIPALKKCGYHARRYEGGPNNIVKGIMDDLAWSGAMVAVLTDMNANVWYELGVRHSFRRGATVMICQEDQISELPFDLKHHGVASYAKELDVDGFVKKIQRHLDDLNRDLKDSPVSEFAHAGSAYCVHRSLGGLRDSLNRIKGHPDDVAQELLERLNREWLGENLQLTALKDDKVFIHQGGVAIGTSANVCFRDPVTGNVSQYAEMMKKTEGLWLGAVEGHLSRLTAFAYKFVSERNWLVVVEAHIKQAEI